MSMSRLRRRAQCARQDWWYTDGAHQGYRRDASPEARTAYALKKLTSLPAVIGIAIHEVAAARARAVRDGRRPHTPAELYERVRASLNRAVAPSNIAAFLHDPASIPMTREAFDGYWPDGRIPPELAARTRRQVEALLHQLVHHPVWADVARCGAEDVLLCDALDAVDLTVQDTPIKVYAAPDLVWVSHEIVHVPGFGIPLLPPVITLCDWKTGRAAGQDDAARTQLAVYAWWATQKLRLAVPPKSFVGRIALLGAEHESERDLSFILRPADIERGRMLMLDAAREIVGERDATGRREMAATSRSLTACRWCAFTSLCVDTTHPLVRPALAGAEDP